MTFLLPFAKVFIEFDGFRLLVWLYLLKPWPLNLYNIVDEIDEGADVHWGSDDSGLCVHGC